MNLLQNIDYEWKEDIIIEERVDNFNDFKND